MKKIILFILLSISIFSEPYEIKNNKVYSLGEILEDADFSSFEALGIAYGKDKINVYFIYEKLVDVDSRSFIYLGGYYGKDKTNVYSGNRKLVDADVQTFKVYKKIKKIKSIYYDSEDKNNYYYEGNIVKDKRK